MRCAAFFLLSGLSLACGISGPVFAQAPGVIRPSPRDPYGEHIAEAAQRFQLPVAWIRAVLAAESNGDPRAISPKGAMGLMQVMPQTWSDLRIRHRLGADPYDPHDNIIAGAAYIRLLYDRYGSSGWIAAYNAGPGRYEASLRGRPLPPETRAYVAAVAPNLDGAGDPGITMVAAIDPLAWTRSALFVGQQTSKPSADSATAERPSGDAPATPIVRDVSAIVPQSNGLFVARASGGTAQ
ncbi:MAG: lytic transglycosylase domain-containing protein [Defluviicoccus sp.]|nr:lytic transglycosylase domain-containing protein [Defluviicoccus sp.]